MRKIIFAAIMLGSIASARADVRDIGFFEMAGFADLVRTDIIVDRANPDRSSIETNDFGSVQFDYRVEIKDTGNDYPYRYVGLSPSLQVGGIQISIPGFYGREGFSLGIGGAGSGTYYSDLDFLDTSYTIGSGIGANLSGYQLQGKPGFDNDPFGYSETEYSFTGVVTFDKLTDTDGNAISGVPETSTWIMMLLGLLMIGLYTYSRSISSYAACKVPA